MMKLIITADDCGLSQGINQAAASLYKEGMLTTASMITNFSHFQHGLELFAAHPGLEIGVHLNLTDGEPLTEAGRSQIASGGKFPHIAVIGAKAFLAGSDWREAVREELHAQIQRLLDAGIQPQHLTTHQHFHLIPALREIVYSLADEFNVAWVRASDYRLSLLPYNILLNRRPVPGKHQFNVPEYLMPMMYWQQQQPERTVEALLQIEGTIEIVVHPGLAHDATFKKEIPYSPIDRYQEMRYFEQFFRLLRPHLGEGVQLGVGE